ncbi:MAG TPA: 6-carboxytetrahydropterin synthase [Flavobacteriales bacterium]|nr:6-carboxytetrahydropterin synthase [Flavobacteriales bacterium]
MALVYITRKEHFNAAHKLWNENWSQEKNLEMFGKCANPNWHGHNYTIYITVKGIPSEDTGYFINLKELSSLIRTKITDRLDHRNLNMDVDFLKGVQTSCENVAVAIWHQLVHDIKKLGGDLHSVKLYETENNYVEYLGE